jgi:hypothetical protein
MRGGQRGGRSCVAVGTLVAGMLLAGRPVASAANPALEIGQYAHTSWKVRDGFVQGAISSIAQTPDGYLWLATEFGLQRFDGVRPVLWQPPPGQHLPAEDTAGNIWIANKNLGLIQLRPDGQVQQLKRGHEIGVAEDLAQEVMLTVYRRAGQVLCHSQGGVSGRGLSIPGARAPVARLSPRNAGTAL